MEKGERERIRGVVADKMAQESDPTITLYCKRIESLIADSERCERLEGECERLREKARLWDELGQPVLKRAGFYGAEGVDWDDVRAIVDASWRISAPHVIYSRRQAASLALTRALKEQEG